MGGVVHIAIEHNGYGKSQYNDFDKNVDALEGLISDYPSGFNIEFNRNQYGVHSFTNKDDRSDFRVLTIWVFDA